MKQYIYNLLEHQGDMTWQQAVTRIAVSAVLAVVIYISYIISHRGTIYSKKFNVTLMVLTVLTTTVMAVIGNNITLSLGMVGALSIVRFRTAIKDSRDTAYIFWTIIVGICCGVGDFLVAAIGSTAAFLIMLLFGSIRSDSRLLLIIRGARNTELAVEALVFKYFSNKATLRAKNSTDSKVEFIFELSSRTFEQKRAADSGFNDAAFAIGGIEYVNFVSQSDEISN